MLPESFAILGIALIWIATIIYLVGTIKGTVKPNRVSFFIWAIAPLIAFAAQISEGVGIQAFLSFSIGAGPLLVLAASFLHKGNAWKLTFFDYSCGIIAIVGLILWQITQDGVLAILLSLIADVFASIPTVVKAYKAPQTESPAAYFITGIGAIITFLTISNWNFATYAFPLYIVLLNVLVFSILRLRSRAKS